MPVTPMALDLAADLPPPQRLALAYASARTRPATLALLALDTRLAAILRGRREPLTAQLRLAWWREMFARPANEWPAGEPLLEALRTWRDPAGLVALVDGWEVLLGDELSAAAMDEFAAGRSQAFACLADELGVNGKVALAARIWALADLAANLSDPDERGRTVERGRDLHAPRLPSALRPLAVLAGLGTAALRNGGAPLLRWPGSALLALRIGVTGR
jgi:phytoene synthase